MPPIFLNRFLDLLSTHGKAAVRTVEARLAAQGTDVLDYTPFEYIEREARLVLVGITPGPTQLELSYAEAGRLIRSGAPTETVLREAKRIAGFGGSSMRPNLVRMLNHFGFAEIYGVPEVESFWESDAHLLHSTSVIPHAAFRQDRMFSGSFAEVMASPVFRDSFMRDFVGSIAELNPNAHFVALGRTPRDALDWCVFNGYLSRNRVLGSLAHPSTNGGSAVDVYLGLKSLEELKPRDPVRHRITQLRADAERMLETTTRLRSATGHMTAEGGLDFIESDNRGLAPTNETKDNVGSQRNMATGQIGNPEIFQAFESAGYVRKSETSKVILFYGPTELAKIYLKDGKGISIIVHPYAVSRAQSVLGNLGRMGQGYHNSNMIEFPKRIHKGENAIAHGYLVNFDTAEALHSFLVAFDFKT